MFSNTAQPHPSSSDTPESRLPFGMLGEVWHDWFETLSQVAYQTHRACEFLAENGGPSNARFGLFDFASSRGPPGGLNGAIDIDKLKQCLQSMDPMQAAQIMHAVQTMHTMEAMLKNKSRPPRSRRELLGRRWS